MRIRRDAVFVSGVLFTIAFLLLVPPSWDNAHAGHDQAALARMGPGFADYAVLLGQSGVADLALILVVLVVIWKGYVKKLRWTWFVMLIIVWGWAFPPLVLPIRAYFRGFNLLDLLDLERWMSWARGPIGSFVLMLAALILPVRSFFRKPGDGPDDAPFQVNRP